MVRTVLLSPLKQIALLLLVVGAGRGAPARAAPPNLGERVARAVESTLELQVELHRRGFSCGPIDGVSGAQTEAALRAFQRSAGLRDHGRLDAATLEAVRITFPAVGDYIFTAADFSSLQPLATTWVGKAAQSALGYASAIELAAERFRTTPPFLRRLNPTVDWEALLPGAGVLVPEVEQAVVAGAATQLVIRLEARELEVVDRDSRVIAHFPVSIARKVEKRPSGELRIAVTVRDPNYTFDPEVFPESAEAREIGRKLIIPPGPNNPVGRVWIGLDLAGYGIHGTPDPEKVGRTESHGCFRLANWDALTLLDLVRVGLPVLVEP